MPDLTREDIIKGARSEFGSKLNNVTDDEIIIGFKSEFPEYNVIDNSQSQQNAIIGSPPAGDAPLGTYLTDTGVSTGQNAYQGAVRDFVNQDLPSNIANTFGVAGRVGVSALTIPTGGKGNFVSAGVMGAIDTLDATAKSLAYGEGWEEAFSRGKTAGSTSAGTELLVGGVLGIGSKTLKSDLVLRSGKKVAKSKAAVETVEHIQLAKKKIASQYSKFSSRISKATEKVRSGLGGGVRNLDSEIQQISNAIDDLTISINKPIVESVGKVRGVISQGYDDLLKGSEGELPIKIDDQLELIANSLNIKTLNGSAKNKLSTIVEALKSLGGDPKSISQLEGLVEKKAEYAVSITLKDAHWLKEALRSIQNPLMKSPVTYDLGKAISIATDGLADGIDKQAGGKYATLSTKWKEMKQVEEATNSAVGRLRTLSGTTTRKGKSKIINALNKAAKDGLEITDDMVREQSDIINTLYANADILEKNNFTKEALKLRQNLYELSSSLLKKNNIKAARKTVYNLAKNTNDENAIALMNTIKNIELDSGKSIYELVDGITKTNADDIVKAQQRMKDLGARAKTGKITYAERQRLLSEASDKAKNDIIKQKGRLSTDVIVGTTLASPLAKFGIMDYATLPLISVAIVLKDTYPQLSHALYKYTESKIGKAMLSETARKSATVLLNQLAKGIADPESSQEQRQ